MNVTGGPLVLCAAMFRLSPQDSIAREQLENQRRFQRRKFFGLARLEPRSCPGCGAENLPWKKILRPAGVIDRRAPHTGYENLGHLPFEAPKLSVRRAPWQAAPAPRAGRLRADAEGETIAMSSGRHGPGYALCLSCLLAGDRWREACRAFERLCAKHRDRRSARWAGPEFRRRFLENARRRRAAPCPRRARKARRSGLVLQ